MTAYSSSLPPPSSPGGPGAPPTPRMQAIAAREIEAVTVAMIVAPGVYARNRMFDFFRTTSAKKARSRAATVRGIVPQLARASSVTLTANGGGMWTLRYVVEAVSLTRVVELSSAELAALRLVAERASVTALAPHEGDKDLVAKSLAKLMTE